MIITMCVGCFVVTDGDNGDIVLRPTDSNSNKGGIVHYFPRQTLFQVQYLVTD